MNPTGMQAAIMRAMMQQQANKQNPSAQSIGNAAAASSQNVDENGNIIPDADVVREWNKYQKWLRAKGMAGKPELDHDNLGLNLFNQWRKESNSPLTVDDFPAIRRMTKAEIDRSYGMIDKGTMILTDANGNFFKTPAESRAYFDTKTPAYYNANEKSANPNYPGMNFTRFSLPEEYDVYSGGKSVKDMKNRKEIEELNRVEKGTKIQYKNQ